MNIMRDECHKLDAGHYEMPLPFKGEKPQLPSNKLHAKRRLEHLGRKFKQSDEYHKQYTKVMDTLLEKGYAESAPNHTTDGQTWYIPHHGVLQPNKLRVVFDCSAKCRGESLNAHLLTGPDFNKLVGVLCRFRLDRVAFMCDIQEMFHQFKVNMDDRDYLRFLWWRDGNFYEEPCKYRMRLHLWRGHPSEDVDETEESDKATMTEEVHPALSLRESSPWYGQFKSIADPAEAQFGDVDDKGRLDNAYYTPGLMAMLVNQFMHIFPLWSAVMLGDIQRYARDQSPYCAEVIHNRVTNSIVESWFGNIKKDFCGGNCIRLRPDQFIRKAYTNVVGRLGELELRPMKKGSGSKGTKNKKQAPWYA